MPKIVIALFLALAAPGLAREPYRPLPRLSDDEVKRRKAEAPPAGPSAPRDEPNASARTEPPAIAPGAPAAPQRLAPGPDAAQPTAPPTPEAFREGLSPYGSRAWSTEHGWISRPRVDAGRKPYYRGQGAWTTYPYGRRAYDPGAGWFWMPGYQPFFSVGFAPSFRFSTFVPFSFHHLPVHRFAIAPRFHGGLFPRTFPAARPVPRMARGPASGGP
jgi:hypothetical protein